MRASASTLGGAVAYRSELATVLHADARDILPTLKTESVGLAVIDPPYGAEWQSRRRGEQFAMLDGDGADDGNRAAVVEILRECVRLVGQHRHVLAGDLVLEHPSRAELESEERAVLAETLEYEIRDALGSLGVGKWRAPGAPDLSVLVKVVPLTGSNIVRKQSVLDALPRSYQPPGHHARAQARGVAVRKTRAAAGGRYWCER